MRVVLVSLLGLLLVACGGPAPETQAPPTAMRAQEPEITAAQVLTLHLADGATVSVDAQGLFVPMGWKSGLRGWYYVADDGATQAIGLADGVLWWEIKSDATR